MQPDGANPAGAGGVRPGHLQSVDGPILVHGAGAIDVRASVDQLDAWQLAWLIQIPDAMHEMAGPRLTAVLTELNERARRMLGEREL